MSEIIKIKERYNKIKKDIEEHSPYPEKVKIIAASKYLDAEGLIPYIAEGVNILGENKPQSLRDKLKILKDKNIYSVEWHFIGNLQKNKIKYMIDEVKLIHSINNYSLAAELDKQCIKKDKIQDVLLEINIYGEESKHGYEVKKLENEVNDLLALKNLNIIGLMTMAPFIDDVEQQRSVFKALKILKDELNKKYFNNKMTELSMGMTNDYKIALEEGATMIRIGRKIFSKEDL